MEQPFVAHEEQPVELEEVLRQLAPLLSLQRPLSFRRFFLLHVCADVAADIFCLEGSVYFFSVAGGGRTASAAAGGWRLGGEVPACQLWLGSCWQHEAAAPCELMPWLLADVLDIQCQVSCSISMERSSLSKPVNSMFSGAPRRSGETLRFFICGRDMRKGTLPSSLMEKSVEKSVNKGGS